MKKFLLGFLSALIIVGIGGYIAKDKYINIENTVVTLEVEEGISADDVIEAMISRAVEENMKYVGNIPLYKELRARGVKTGHLEIFQFCNPTDAKLMTDISPSFAAYLPCRISLIENKGKLFLTMMDLKLVINAAGLEGDLLKIANTVDSQLNSIIQAGASGEF